MQMPAQILRVHGLTPEDHGVGSSRHRPDPIKEKAAMPSLKAQYMILLKRNVPRQTEYKEVTALLQK